MRLPGHLGRRRGEPAPGEGDEQPLDASAIVEAELCALAVTHDSEHGARAQRAFEWFLGRNRLGLPLYDFATGGCSDGVGDEAVNANEGAESTLAFHRAQHVLEAAGLRRVVRRASATRSSRVSGSGVSERRAERAARALPPASRQPDPDRRRLAGSVNVVFNPAAALVGGETVLVARVEALTGISHLTVARSANGIDGWSVAREPLLAPAEGVESEQWGFEDARVVWVDELDRS